jgi:hypothetical protein
VSFTTRFVPQNGADVSVRNGDAMSLLFCLLSAIIETNGFAYPGRCSLHAFRVALQNVRVECSIPEAGRYIASSQRWWDGVLERLEAFRCTEIEMQMQKPGGSKEETDSWEK